MVSDIDTNWIDDYGFMVRSVIMKYWGPVLFAWFNYGVGVFVGYLIWG